ncbi:hypothetical protein O3S81_04000 [Agrobacterium sp. SOY23]|uniref:hypothetical protein n=1 Tax=Agrobacterium sp. SOY23 TaxID=3014555 RepID=UPI0022AFFE0F|nr:hypothetical protein [Agrobacterium sp. SOY23]MCZ4428855.1 hypothetical protein [Agrobacterium sp. SOY23]
MKKTAQAREAYILYKQKNILRLIFHTIKLFLYTAAPATVIAYLTDHVSGLFYILTPLFIYFFFPVWFGFYVASALLTQMSGESLGKGSLLGENPSFSDVTFHLTGFRVKDESDEN